MRALTAACAVAALAAGCREDEASASKATPREGPPAARDERVPPPAPLAQAVTPGAAPEAGWPGVRHDVGEGRVVTRLTSLCTHPRGWAFAAESAALWHDVRQRRRFHKPTTHLVVGGPLKEEQRPPVDRGGHEMQGISRELVALPDTELLASACPSAGMWWLTHGEPGVVVLALRDAAGKEAWRARLPLGIEGGADGPEPAPVAPMGVRIDDDVVVAFWNAAAEPPALLAERRRFPHSDHAAVAYVYGARRRERVVSLPEGVRVLDVTSLGAGAMLVVGEDQREGKPAGAWVSFVLRSVGPLEAHAEGVLAGGDRIRWLRLMRHGDRVWAPWRTTRVPHVAGVLRIGRDGRAHAGEVPGDQAGWALDPAVLAPWRDGRALLLGVDFGARRVTAVEVAPGGLPERIDRAPLDDLAPEARAAGIAWGPRALGLDDDGDWQVAAAAPGWGGQVTVLPLSAIRSGSSKE